MHTLVNLFVETQNPFQVKGVRGLLVVFLAVQVLVLVLFIVLLLVVTVFAVHFI